MMRGRRFARSPEAPDSPGARFPGQDLPGLVWIRRGTAPPDVGVGSLSAEALAKADSPRRGSLVRHSLGEGGSPGGFIPARADSARATERRGINGVARATERPGINGVPRAMERPGEGSGRAKVCPRFCRR